MASRQEAQKETAYTSTLCRHTTVWLQVDRLSIMLNCCCVACIMSRCWSCT